MVAPLPLYHIYALTCNCLFMLKDGGCNLLIPNPRDIPGFIQELKKNRFTAISGLNTLYNRAAQSPEFSSIDFSHLRPVVRGRHGDAKGGREDRWHKATKVPILEGYGLHRRLRRSPPPNRST
jgi:long-chain acyl-CoA synthetase